MTIINVLRYFLRSGLDPFRLSDLSVGRRRRNQAVIRGLAQSSFIGRGLMLGRVLGRYKMLLDADDRGLSPHLILDGFWEMWVTEAIADVVKPGMIVADIGANLGYFTMIMAELVGPSGQVHAFEPNPALAAMVSTSSHMNGFDDRVKVHAAALGANDIDLFRLVIPEGYPSGGHLSPVTEQEMASLSPEALGTDPALITAQRFDAYPELALVDVVKIDAEGAERAIWNGMDGIFRGDRPLVVLLEFASCRYTDPGLFLNEIVARNFDLAIVTMDKGVKPVSINEILSAHPHQDQMLMLRRV